jgi:peptide chain release factor subunit 1
MTEEIEKWKTKKLIKTLNLARGNGTSMVSLIVPPGDQISRVSKMLTDEAATASNIKSRVNRNSVLQAISSAQQRLKLYDRLPPNGLVMYCGMVATETGKEKQLAIDFEPYKPINTSMYICDGYFHTKPLDCLLESNSSFGFVIMDGSCTLFGRVSGNNRVILQQIREDLPKKHNKGGQSAQRFGRIRVEKRHNYVRKVAEIATQQFITDDVPNVTGLVLAGLAEFKNDLLKSDLFDPRLQKIVVAIVDIAYGGEKGFNQAIDLASESLLNVRYVAEKKILSKFFTEIDRDTGKFCYGIRDIAYAIEQNAIDTLILYEDLEMNRLTLKNRETGEVSFLFASGGQRNIGADFEVIEETSATDYFAENYNSLGFSVEFVTDKSEEGSQFCRGFGGIGAILRYKMDVYIHGEVSEDEDDSEFM